MKPTLVVMAAGMGSRYGGLKQIDPVGPGGEIVIDYSVYDALKAGFGKVVFIIRRELEAPFREVIEPHFGGRVPIGYAFQEIDQLPKGFTVPEGRTKPWGTAHAVLSAKALLHEPFAVINADDFYGRQSFQVIADRLAKTPTDRATYCMVGFILRHTLSEHGHVTRGVCQTNEAGRLVRIDERLQIERDGAAARYFDEAGAHPLAGHEPVSMNLWGFNPTVFDLFEKAFPDFLQKAKDQPKAEFLIPAEICKAVQQGAATVDVLPTNADWFGVTYPEDKPAVMAGIRALIDRGLYPEKLWA